MLEIKKLENDRKVAFMREYGNNCGMYISTTLHKEFESMPLSCSHSILYGQCVISLVISYSRMETWRKSLYYFMVTDGPSSLCHGSDTSILMCNKFLLNQGVVLNLLYG
jgi:hypothetical protein